MNWTVLRHALTDWKLRGSGYSKVQISLHSGSIEASECSSRPASYIVHCSSLTSKRLRQKCQRETGRAKGKSQAWN